MRTILMTDVQAIREFRQSLPSVDEVNSADKRTLRLAIAGYCERHCRSRTSVRANPMEMAQALREHYQLSDKPLVYLDVEAVCDFLDS